jgi:polyisoprenoid-binding protein YceI
MRTTLTCLIALLIALPLPAGHLTSGTWTLDPHRSMVAFTVVKNGIERVDGRFRAFRGTITYDEANPSRSSIEWRVKIASVETGKRGRDQTLQQANYFDAGRYPEMAFAARGVERLANGSMRFTGTLTIRGVSKPLTIVATQIRCDPKSPMFSARFDLDRFDFGVSGGPVLVSRNVNVRLLAVGVPK